MYTLTAKLARDIEFRKQEGHCGECKFFKGAGASLGPGCVLHSILLPTNEKGQYDEHFVCKELVVIPKEDYGKYTKGINPEYINI